MTFKYTHRAVVRVHAWVFTLSNMNISETSGPITIKFREKSTMLTMITYMPVFSFTSGRPTVFSSPELKAHKVSCKYTHRAVVRVRACVFTLSNMNISETSGPITIKFYLKHHWGGRKTALCFGADQIRSVSMATDNGKNLS